MIAELADLVPDARRCASLLQDLLRLRTVNRSPLDPSEKDESDGEREAAQRLADFFADHGIESELLEGFPGRTNIVARLKGSGELPPLLLNAHLDVVEADETQWRVPPFEGRVQDGYLWGRGAVDMKNMAAMSAAVLVMLKERGVPLKRDVIFAGVADEEAGCVRGSLWLAKEHPDKIRAEYMLGEVGGFSLNLFGKTFYPIQVAEKGTVWLRATYTGEPGHGSMPKPNSAVLKLAKALTKLGKTRLPMHPTEAVRGFVDGLAKGLPPIQGKVLGRLTTPQVAGLILDYLVKDDGQRNAFAAMLSNTASPTILHGGNKVNVIPGRASVAIDGRTLPGQTEAVFLQELRAVLGEEAQFEVFHRADPVITPTDTPLFAHLGNVLRRHDPTATPLPYLTVGFTDAKAYAALGTKSYGFSPVRFDPTADLSFSRMYHGHDERIPLDGLAWGLTVLYEVVSEFAGGKTL